MFLRRKPACVILESRVYASCQNRLDLVYVKPRQLHAFWLLIVGAGVGGAASPIDIQMWRLSLNAVWNVDISPEK